MKSLPTIFTRKSTWRFTLLGVYLVTVTLLLFRAFRGWGYDDPYITYRYAQNIINGVGFVFNPGEQVLSTTTPLFAIILAVLSPIWDNAPHLANLISAFSVALGAVFLWDLSQTWKSPAAGWASLLLYPLFPILLRTTGSETPLFLALCLGGFAFYARKLYYPTAFCAALALLTRPDGILVAGILSLDYIIRIRKPIPWGPILLFSLITAPWVAFAWVYFGSPIPITLTTKIHQGSMAIAMGYLDGAVVLFKNYYSQGNYRIEIFLILVGFAYLLWRSYRDRFFRRWLVFYGWIALYFLSYSILNVSSYFWYYAPLVPGIVGLIGLGVEAIVKGVLAVFDLLTRRKVDALQSKHPTTILTFSMIMIIGALAYFQFEDINQLRREIDQRILIYREIGQWIGDNIPQNASLGALEVGIIGYYGQRPLVDFAGLIKPEVGEQLSRDFQFDEAALWAMKTYHPEYLVLQEAALPAFEEAYVRGNCVRVKNFKGVKFDYPVNIGIFQCGELMDR